MRTSHEKTIDGVTLTLRQLPAMRAMKFFRVLVGCFGPAMMQMTGESGGEDGGSLSSAIDKLMMELSEDMLQKVIDTLFLDALVEQNGSNKNLMGAGGAFDLVFQGKIFTVFKFLYFALEVNYGDFIEGFNSGDLQGLGLVNQSESPKE